MRAIPTRPSLDSATQQQATFATNIENGEHVPVRADATGRLLPAAKVSQCAAVNFRVLHWMKAFVLHGISNAGSLELLLKLIRGQSTHHSWVSGKI